MKRARIPGAFALLACVAMSSPMAGAADDLGWYGGASIGKTNADKIDEVHINSTLVSASFATAAVTSRDERGTGYKLFAGYQFNKNFALEGGYFDLGKFNFVSTTTGPAGALTGTLKPRGVNLDAVGMLPITGNFSAIGRVGAQYADPNDSYTGTGAVVVLSSGSGKRDTNYKLGFGLQYDLTKSLGLRGEVERYRITDAASQKSDIDLYSVGLVYRFGAKTPAPAPRAVTPAPAAAPAAAPAPRPKAVTPPPPPKEAVTPPPPPQQAPARRDRN